jgi:hypothetical protein
MVTVAPDLDLQHVPLSEPFPSRTWRDVFLTGRRRFGAGEKRAPVKDEKNSQNILRNVNFP